ncbi:hypothetical protein HK099_000945 [Clydaea vesicula]|uniref:Uncharacterized protein n=1 Tax=Clydaea vesicula TaxID=447962 RepID=A0AAD5U440_9FUNG|nr:hypothetical protein HK099_000945 [Clydaea vesicula]KAJ3391336.1 hypothetical protein HDU92_009103 [Lobulomyces angularis]
MTTIKLKLSSNLSSSNNQAQQSLEIFNQSRKKEKSVQFHTSFLDTKKAYLNKYRPNWLKDTLLHHGFDTENGEKSPHPCFELYLKKNNPPKNSIEEVANKIRSSQEYFFNFYGFDQQRDLDLLKEFNKNDKKIFTAYCSEYGYNGYFWSFCAERMENITNVWHCRECECCFDWNFKHCLQCNKCSEFSKDYYNGLNCDRCFNPGNSTPIKIHSKTSTNVIAVRKKKKNNLVS